MATPVTVSLRTIARNAFSVLASDAVTRASTFVLYALVTRHLGLFSFGQLSLALTLYYTVQVLAAGGLKTLIIREVSRDRSLAGPYLVNGSAIVVVATLISIAVLTGFVRVMGYAPDTALVILLVSLALFPYSLSVIYEALFQAAEEMHYIAYVNVPGNVFKVVGAFVLLTAGQGLNTLILLIVLSQALIAVVELWFVLKRVTWPRLQLDLGFIRHTVQATAPFLGIDVLIAISASMTIILLSRLRSETDVGLLSAPAQLTTPVALLYQSVVLSLFPLMCRSFKPGFEDLKRISERVTEVLLVIGVPIIIGLSFLAEPILVLVYGGQDFALAALALRILVWELFLRTFTTSLGQVLLAGRQERQTLLIVAINTVVCLVLGLILISQFGFVGAAITGVVTRAVGVAQHYVRVSRTAGHVNLLRPLLRPGLAGLCMAAFLALGTTHGLVATVAAAAVVYTTVLFALTVWSVGGFRNLRAQYLYRWSE